MPKIQSPGLVHISLQFDLLSHSLLYQKVMNATKAAAASASASKQKAPAPAAAAQKWIYSFINQKQYCHILLLPGNHFRCWTQVAVKFLSFSLDFISFCFLCPSMLGLPAFRQQLSHLFRFSLASLQTHRFVWM